LGAVPNPHRLPPNKEGTMKFFRFTPGDCTDTNNSSRATLLKRHNTLIRSLFGYNSVSVPWSQEGLLVMMCEEIERLHDEVEGLKKGRCA
jgi:hypothetical protein